ncbi:MAG: hypothetical protein AB7E61_07180 [Acholeplasmataceae bacterium]
MKKITIEVKLKGFEKDGYLTNDDIASAIEDTLDDYNSEDYWDAKAVIEIKNKGDHHEIKLLSFTDKSVILL